MRSTILFLEQQSWLGGAQRVLEATLDSIDGVYNAIVSFPEPGSFRAAVERRPIETIDVPIGSYAPGRKSLLQMAAFVCRSVYCGLKLAAFIRRKRIALLYINGPRCLPAGVLAAWLTGRPSIFHLHLILERPPDVYLARLCSRRVSRIVACSHAAAASLMGNDARLASKIQVLYNPIRRSARAGVMPFRVKDGRDGRVTVGVVGRITERKGHHLLLEAVGQLPASLRERIQLLVVGAAAPGCAADLQYVRFLNNEAARLGLQDQIVWTGHQTELASHFAAMDVMIHPALSEAMCIAILEALDSGTPVIAARTGGIPEIVQDGVNGLLVSVQDQKALAEALTLFLSSDQIRDRLRSGARQGVDQRFSMEVFSSRIRATIGEVCPPSVTGEASFRAGLERW